MQFRNMHTTESTAIDYRESSSEFISQTNHRLAHSQLQLLLTIPIGFCCPALEIHYSFYFKRFFTGKVFSESISVTQVQESIYSATFKSREVNEVATVLLQIFLQPYLSQSRYGCL